MKGAATVVIVGSGLSGLACAKQLAAHSVSSVLLLDKGRKVGGRLSTVTQSGTGVWDKGAPFFTVRSQEFQEQTDSWPSRREWCKGFVNSPDGHSRFLSAGGMREIAQNLSKELPYEVLQKAEVQQIGRIDNRFLLTLKDGRQFEAAHVVLTAPMVQSLALLERGGIQHPDIEPLKHITYDKTITCLLRLKSAAAIPPPGGWQKPCQHVHFIASSKQKGLSKEECLTVHFDPAFSDAHFEKSKEELEQPIMEALAQFFDRSEVEDWSIHKWRYAIPSKMFPERYLEIDFEGGSLSFCGDCFKQIAVEGSFMSGWTLGKHLVSKM